MFNYTWAPASGSFRNCFEPQSFPIVVKVKTVIWDVILLDFFFDEGKKWSSFLCLFRRRKIVFAPTFAITLWSKVLKAEKWRTVFRTINLSSACVCSKIMFTQWSVPGWLILVHLFDFYPRRGLTLGAAVWMRGVKIPFLRPIMATPITPIRHMHLWAPR